MPRNAENDPSVTINGGILNSAISAPLSAPPPHPINKVTSIASGIGQCQSITSDPNTTAQSPIIDPTERSIPPVIITGVNASASNPSSTLSRITSRKFAVVKKFCATTEKIPTSASKASSTIHSPLGNQRFIIPVWRELQLAASASADVFRR